MKKIYFLLILAGICFAGCCNDKCKVDPVAVEEQKDCKTYFITLDQFNAHCEKVLDSTGKVINLIPDSTYYICSFMFPTESTSGGYLINDTRFDNATEIPVVSLPFSNGQFRVAAMTSIPTNEECTGDVLVASVDTLAKTANLRFSGWLYRLDKTLYTEISSTLCDYVNANRSKLSQIFNTIFHNDNYKYGKNISGASSTNYGNTTAVITDKNGNYLGPLSGAGMPTVPGDVLIQFYQKLQEKYAVNVTVSAGSMFAYISTFNKRFIVLVTEIRQSPLSPHRNRVTMMFVPFDN